MRHQLKSGNAYLCNNPAASIADIWYGLFHRATARANRYTNQKRHSAQQQQPGGFNIVAMLAPLTTSYNREI